MLKLKVEEELSSVTNNLDDDDYQSDNYFFDNEEGNEEDGESNSNKGSGIPRKEGESQQNVASEVPAIHPYRLMQPMQGMVDPIESRPIKMVVMDAIPYFNIGRDNDYIII